MINYVSRLLMGNEQRDPRAPQLDDHQTTDNMNDTTPAEDKDTRE